MTQDLINALPHFVKSQYNNHRFYRHWVPQIILYSRSSSRRSAGPVLACNAVLPVGISWANEFKFYSRGSKSLCSWKIHGSLIAAKFCKVCTLSSTFTVREIVPHYFECLQHIFLFWRHAKWFVMFTSNASAKWFVMFTSNASVKTLKTTTLTSSYITTPKTALWLISTWLKNINDPSFQH